MMKPLPFLFLLTLTFCASAQTEVQLQQKVVKLMGEENYKEALPVIEQLVALDPDQLLYISDRAVVNFHLKNYKASLKDYKLLNKENPAVGEYNFQIGNIYENLDSTKQAEVYYSMAIGMDQENYLYYFKRGTFYLKHAQYTKAISDYDQSLKLNPEHNNSFHNRGIALYKIGEKVRACEDWCQALLYGNPYSASHLEKNCKKYPEPCLPVNEKP